jgi:predicted regulator of amino acid metabolism with ACT domain
MRLLTKILLAEAALVWLVKLLSPRPNPLKQIYQIAGRHGLGVVPVTIQEAAAHSVSAAITRERFAHRN